MKRKKRLTQHSDDGLSGLSLLRVSMDRPLRHRIQCLPGTVPDPQAHPRVNHQDHQHRYQEEYDAAQLVKRELRHVRQEHRADRRVGRVITRA